MAGAARGPLWSIFLLIIANLLIPSAILVFGTGFFPYKPILPGLAEFESLEFGQPPHAPFDKVVFMVIDALRSDFVFSENSGFTYTQSLIRDGSAVPFTANARSPTVTMPRLKSMTTGSIPSFVDLILNIDEGDTSSSLAAQDTWLAQLKANGKGKLLMFGDDTWLKLFPGTFDRYDGTSSFFVSDFTEVDNNVTRNVAPELHNEDWSLMVLHYLGLDHIGHKSGPRSVNMAPKQQEMDGIVREIVGMMLTKSHLKSTLLVICGDHGMNDAGNHGASSPGETSPALVFVSPKMKDLSLTYQAPVEPDGEFEYYSMVEQSDLAPTLAALLGFPVPKNNLGAIITEFLPFWPKGSDKVQLLVRNARQILSIVTAAFGADLFDSSGKTDPCTLDPTEINKLACDWRKLGQEAGQMAKADRIDEQWLSSMAKWLRDAQELMSSMASNYDMPRLFLGQGLAVAGVVASVAAMYLTSTPGRGSLSPLILTTVLNGVMMFASSYVEEEQHFWYWATSIWLAFLGVREIRRTGKAFALAEHLLTMAAFRLLRSWNQTGQKFAGEPDIVKTYLHWSPNLLWLLVLAMYVLVSFQLLPGLDGLPYAIVTSLASILITTAFSFKLAFTAEDAPELVVGFASAVHDAFQGQSLLFRARLVFALLAVAGGYAVYRSFAPLPRVTQSTAKTLHTLCTILAMTQSRATNIPLFLLSSVLLYQLQSSSLTRADITTTAILLQHATFFAFGGSNAISSVDLSSAYNGISGYSIVAVGALTLISNWAGPIFWTSATISLLLENRRKNVSSGQVFLGHVALLTGFATTSVAFVMAACTALRTHLFIWTVFSPKYLYCMAWSLGQHLIFNVGFGGVLFWLGAR